jgi:hypothetical protein
MRWTILDGRHATASYHEVIQWEFSVNTQEEADHVQVIGWNLAAMSKEDEKAVEKLWKELQGQRARIDKECTGVLRGYYSPIINTTFIRLYKAAYLTSLFSSSYPKTQPLVQTQERPLKTVPIFFLIVNKSSIDMFLER